MNNLQGLKISPHPKAPLFSRKEENLGKILGQLEICLQNNNPVLSREEINVLRQAGFVSLFFFIKFICGKAGPYDKLSYGLHREMCNFYQEMAYPGSRAFFLLPRGHGKTMIGTECGSAWDILRDPNITIRIANAKAEIGTSFMHSIERIFDSNKFFALLYPEYVPENNSKKWNDEEMVIPCRTKQKRESTVSSSGIGGASEGMHYDVLKVDDMFGLKSLTTGMTSGAEMEKARNWFKTQTKSLLVSPKESRVWGSGTRYAVDDGYNDILLDCRKFWGSPAPGYFEQENGHYDVYYRPFLEDGKAILPEFYPDDFLNDMDQWTAATQYMNNPAISGIMEFNMFKVKKCVLDFDDKMGFIISYFLNGIHIDIPLKDCDVVIACDPGATEGYSRKRSRSAVGVLACAPNNEKFLISLNAGFVGASIMFDWLFSFAKKFKNYTKKTVVEAQGPFKILIDLLKKEEYRRNNGAKEQIYLHLRPVSSPGNKDEVIRNTLEPEFKEKRLYVEEHYIDMVNEELAVFPHSNKKDVLDMLTMAINNVVRPLTDVEIFRRSKQNDRFKNRSCNAAGY